MPSFEKRQCPACNQVKEFRTDAKTCGCAGKHPNLLTVAAENKVEIDLKKLEYKEKGKDKEIKILHERIFALEDENEVLSQFCARTPQASHIPSKVSKNKSESVAVVLWSDHHCEEHVRPETIGDLNEYNIDIYKKRFENLCHGTLSWLRIGGERTEIKTLVLALLGDFISGSIHEELAESNLLAPTEAIFLAQNQLVSGIQFLLDATPKDMEILIVCHSGNHGRITKKQRIATEAGNSLEHYMYCNIREFFKKEDRIKWQISEGYHSTVKMFDPKNPFKIRFHHGHWIKYRGGVGGFTIPVNRDVNQWNKAGWVNLDAFGHFHQRFDGGNFVINGSLIGYNAFALSIKASYEIPSQMFFLVNRDYMEKTLVAPIFVQKG